MDMYMNDGEPSEKCGDLNFGLEYDFATQTLKLKIIRVLFFQEGSQIFAPFFLKKLTFK